MKIIKRAFTNNSVHGLEHLKVIAENYSDDLFIDANLGPHAERAVSIPTIIVRIKQNKT